MRRVLALVDDSRVAAAVAATASTIARVNSLVFDLVSYVEPGDIAERTIPALDESAPPWRPRVSPGPIRTALVTELADESVAVVVLGARASEAKPDGLGHIARMVATTSDRPLVLVPPDASPLVGDDLRFLLPLDGHRHTSESVIPTVEDLITPMGRVIPLHVFGDSTMPMLMSSDEDRAVIAKEFAARHTAGMADRTDRTRLGLGNPADEILAAIHREHVDAVILCWSQRLEPGRADVVRRLLAEGRTVVVLDPIG